MSYVIMNLTNLKMHCGSKSGNLYYRHLAASEYKIVNGFTYNELDDMLRGSYKIVYVEGPPIKPFTEAELRGQK